MPLEWQLQLDFYLITDPGNAVVVPYHAYDVSIEEYGRPVTGDRRLPKQHFQFRAVQSPENLAQQPPESRNPLVASYAGHRDFTEELRLVGPGSITLIAHTTTEALDPLPITRMSAKLRLQPVNMSIPVLTEVVLSKADYAQHPYIWLYKREV